MLIDLIAVTFVYLGERIPVYIEGKLFSHYLKIPNGSYSCGGKRTYYTLGGKLHGDYLVNIREKIIVTGQYKMDKKHGLWKYYNDNGGLNAVEYFIDGDKKFTQEWYANGKVYHISHYKYESLKWSKKWYRNGQFKSKSYYENGVQVGPIKTFHDNGQLANIINYVKGFRHGLAQYWCVNNENYTVCYFRGDKLYGPYERYYKGKLMERMNYIIGKLHGLHEKWDCDGNLLLRKTYIKGRVFE
jgi:antitoxin component YwqK of YwqJK toxin-antitoxin module